MLWEFTQNQFDVEYGTLYGKNNMIQPIRVLHVSELYSTMSRERLLSSFWFYNTEPHIKTYRLAIFSYVSPSIPLHTQLGAKKGIEGLLLSEDSQSYYLS